MPTVNYWHWLFLRVMHPAILHKNKRDGQTAIGPPKAKHTFNRE